MCPCLGLPQPGTAVGDMQNSWCVRSGMCSAVREQGAVLVLLEQQVLPVQLKHCLEEVGVPLQPQRNAWGRGRGFGQELC